MNRPFFLCPDLNGASVSHQNAAIRVQSRAKESMLELAHTKTLLGIMKLRVEELTAELECAKRLAAGDREKLENEERAHRRTRDDLSKIRVNF